jgi:hypothetical protein
MGRMTRSEAMRSPYKNVITRALGTQGRVTPDVFGMEAEPQDLFLLCTDGLTRELPDQTIASLLSKDSAAGRTLCRSCRCRKKGRRPRQHHLPGGSRRSLKNSDWWRGIKSFRSPSSESGL